MVLLIVAFLGVGICPVWAQPWSMGFRTPWGVEDPLSDLNWSALTHVIHVGVEPQSDGSLLYSDPRFDVKARALIFAAHRNRVKVLLNVWSGPSSDFVHATDNLGRLVTNIEQVVGGYGYDGVDIDWEQRFDPAKMGSLLRMLRIQLPGTILTAEALAGRDEGAKWAPLAVSLDRINMMTYDMGGFWDSYSWFNSALYGPPGDPVASLDWAVRVFVVAGIPRSQLNIGLPFYGYIYLGSGVIGPHVSYPSPLPSRNQITYSALVNRYDLSHAVYDRNAHVPWLGLSDGWITFDDAHSIRAKVRYVQQQGLGGFIIWALDSDYLPSQPIKHPLLNAVGLALHGEQSSYPLPSASSSR